jgi:hypothetical protein
MHAHCSAIAIRGVLGQVVELRRPPNSSQIHAVAVGTVPPFHLVTTSTNITYLNNFVR